MRNISFALTTVQIWGQSKTVTRRLGWAFLKHGDLIQPVEKSQGLKKGQHVKKIGCPIRVVDVRRERLDRMISDDRDNAHRIGTPEVAAEGFPLMSAVGFVSMFCNHNGCQQWDDVTRIQFEYVEPLFVSEVTDAESQPVVDAVDPVVQP